MSLSLSMDPQSTFSNLQWAQVIAQSETREGLDFHDHHDGCHHRLPSLFQSTTLIDTLLSEGAIINYRPSGKTNRLTGTQISSDLRRTIQQCLNYQYWSDLPLSLIDTVATESQRAIIMIIANLRTATATTTDHEKMLTATRPSSRRDDRDQLPCDWELICPVLGEIFASGKD